MAAPILALKGEKAAPQIHITDAGMSTSLQSRPGHDIQSQNLRNKTTAHSPNFTTLQETQQPPPENKNANMLECFEFFGEDDFAVAFFFGLITVLATALIAFFVLSWSWLTAIAIVVAVFILFRHVSLKFERPHVGRDWISRGNQRQSSTSIPDIDYLPAVYFLYVLGSGGHTTEMLEIIRQKIHGQPNQHRRYVINKGDSSSQERVQQLESIIRDAYPDERVGTRDAFLIRRARDVHQSALTAPLTCLMSAGQAVLALTREPKSRPAARYGYQFKYPHVVVTNGPATGFIICVVARLLKIFYLVPQNRLKMVYIESWARTQTMSLTGRLFAWTGIADMVCVQHQSLARRTGAEYIGAIAAPLALQNYNPED
ncbi:oligosaccharide biosynthesis protein Alg14 like-domain-containing protein [Podospora didyma]|uniref:UDP-N-acetylglucosamine transferase subunit ALG14 n=1 Tax=Podospora didyma TaxID=330526 RepID=A0AAE0U1V2_9PEZI|nr:oligosaccharide biosynthesis protein Alg14 like-domain-containing protein [Podospora didyma]